MHRADKNGAEHNPQKARKPTVLHAGQNGARDRADRGDRRKMLAQQNKGFCGNIILTVINGNGEHMVYVRNWYMPGARNTTDASSEEEVFFVELGMTSESTQITVNYGQTDVYTDDYVPGAPAEVLTGMYRDAII
jgi:hypothetical protein